MGILDVEHRVVLRRLDHLGEVEIHLRFGLAGQHGEAHHVLAHFLDHVGDGDEIARALGHLGRLAAAQQLHHLHQLDVERDRLAPASFALVKRGDGGLDPLDRAGMVSAPDVDQRVGAFRLLHVIGEVGAEIGPAAVGLADRAVLIVAEFGRAEQRQLDRLPVLGRLALGRFEHAVIDQVVRAQPLSRPPRACPPPAARPRRRTRRAECRASARSARIMLHHRAPRPGRGTGRQPFAFGRVDVLVAELVGQRLPDRLRGNRRDRGLRESRRYPRPAPRGNAGAPSGRAYRPAPPASLT